MELMRSKARSTRLLILLRLVLEAPPDQKALSDAIGITPQAASLYLRDMEQEGLIDRTRKGPRAAVKGVEMLHRDLLSLKEFVDTSIMRLDIVRSTDAVAKGRIRKGERCGLFMEDGVLMARSGAEGPSTGTADRDAEDGCMVPLSELSGVMDLRPGTLHIHEVRPVRLGGGSDRIRQSELKPNGRGNRSSRRLAALDMEAMALLRRSGVRYDSELPSTEDVKGMLQRGLDVLVFGTPHSISGLKAALGGFTDRVVEARSSPLSPDRGNKG